KLFGIEATRRVSDQALFIHGGMGYEKSLPIERIYRDARSLWFEEGTPTVQKLVIGRDVLGKRIRQSGK
ncbi:MAG: acyl-CoA dehydrogenase family protein, partial [Chloroflexota bacterium]